MIGLSPKTIMHSTGNVTARMKSKENWVILLFLVHFSKSFLSIFKYLNVAGLENISRQLSLHPAHLKPDTNGNLPPSALIPFCSYQGDHSLLGQEIQGFQNITLCDKFEPSILEGQLCYSLNIAKLNEKPTKTGKKAGLYLLLDPNPYPIMSIDEKAKTDRNDQQLFKVYIHTLGEHRAFGPGIFALHTLTRMTAKPNFYQMPDSQKECQIHSREKCQTEMFLNQVRSKCSCVPWALTIEKNSMKVIFIFVY